MLGDHDISSLRTCVSAGEHLPAATWHAWREATGIGIVDGIGATEMMHIFISASGDDIRPGATGKAVPGYVAAVLDEAGEPMASGTGRLAVKGPTGCRYFDDERQADYVQGGWNVTGDTYRKDEDGYFWYVARSDDMIVSSGYNIAAPEVENALYAHPAVQECAVIGAPCPERGQKVKAFVVLAPGYARRRGHRRRAPGPCEGGDRALQISARDRIRRSAAQDRDRQAPAFRAAGTSRPAKGHNSSPATPQSRPSMSVKRGAKSMKRLTIGAFVAAQLLASARSPPSRPISPTARRSGAARSAASSCASRSAARRAGIGSAPASRSRRRCRAAPDRRSADADRRGPRIRLPQRPSGFLLGRRPGSALPAPRRRPGQSTTTTSRPLDRRDPADRRRRHRRHRGRGGGRFHRRDQRQFGMS